MAALVLCLIAAFYGVILLVNLLARIPFVVFPVAGLWLMLMALEHFK